MLCFDKFNGNQALPQLGEIARVRQILQNSKIKKSASRPEKHSKTWRKKNSSDIKVKNKERKKRNNNFLKEVG